MRRFADPAYLPYTLDLRIAVGKAQIELDLLCVALTSGQPEEVSRFIERTAQAAPLPSDVETLPVLIAPHIGQESRMLCQQAGVGYLDLRGNCTLDASSVYVELRQQPDRAPSPRTTGSLFEGKSERIVRRLLLEPEYHWTIRSLAEAAEVSIGLTSSVTTALAQAGYVTKGRRGLDLYAPKKLLDGWAQSYDLRRSVFSVFRTPSEPEAVREELRSSSDSLAGQLALTLWSAADALLPEQSDYPHVALYWMGRPEELADSLGLTPDKGNTCVFVFRPYDESVMWGADAGGDGLPAVHPVQLYLDLASGDEDELRLAHAVRERLLPW